MVPRSGTTCIPATFGLTVGRYRNTRRAGLFRLPSVLRRKTRRRHRSPRPDSQKSRFRRGPGSSPEIVHLPLRLAGSPASIRPPRPRPGTPAPRLFRRTYSARLANFVCLALCEPESRGFPPPAGCVADAVQAWRLLDGNDRLRESGDEVASVVPTQPRAHLQHVLPVRREKPLL